MAWIQVEDSFTCRRCDGEFTEQYQSPSTAKLGQFCKDCERARREDRKAARLAQAVAEALAAE